MKINLVHLTDSTVQHHKFLLKLLILLNTLYLILNTFYCYPQNGVSVNRNGSAADNSAIIDISSTSQGLLIPRMTTEQRNLITSPATSLLIFNTTTNCFETYVNSSWYSVSCPTPTICSQFQKTFGGTGLELGYTVEQTSDGGYILACTTSSFGSVGYNSYLVKTDGDGNLLWSKNIEGSSDELTYSVVQTSDGGYILTGITNLSGSGVNEIYLIRTDNSGNLLWSKTFGGTNDDYAWSVRQTSEGGFIIGASTKSFGAGNYDFYLIKTDGSGNLLWSNTYGGTGDERAWYVQQTSDGGYIMGGITNSFGAGGYDYYLVKTDSIGNLTWNKTYGGSAGDWALSLQQTSDGGYIITGYTASFGAGQFDWYLVKTDGSGNLLWNKTYGGSGDDIARSVHQIIDGGFIITGYTTSFGAGGYDCYLVRTDGSGNLTWSRTYGGINNDLGYYVQQTSDKGLIMTGMSESFGAGQKDVYLVKTDENGDGGGCNTTIPVTNVSSPISTVTSPIPTVTSPATSVTNPTTIVTSPATIVTKLCNLCK
jgi:hypothetical protein